MRRFRILALGVIALVVLSACEYREVDGVGTRTHDDDFVPQDDITEFAGCVQAGGGQWQARGEITNHTPDRATYAVTIAFEAGDVRIDERTLWIRDLAPGQTAMLDRAWWIGEADRVTGCQVLTIDRFRTPIAS